MDIQFLWYFFIAMMMNCVNSQQICSEYIEGCLECVSNDSTKCMSCIKNYQLVQSTNSCKEICSNGQVYDDSKKSCQVSCAEYNQMPDLNSQTCQSLPSCPEMRIQQDYFHDYELAGLFLIRNKYYISYDINQDVYIWDQQTHQLVDKIVRALQSKLLGIDEFNKGELLIWTFREYIVYSLDMSQTIVREDLKKDLQFFDSRELVKLKIINSSQGVDIQVLLQNIRYNQFSSVQIKSKLYENVVEISNETQYCNQFKFSVKGDYIAASLYNSKIYLINLITKQVDYISTIVNYRFFDNLFEDYLYGADSKTVYIYDIKKKELTQTQVFNDTAHTEQYIYVLMIKQFQLIIGINNYGFFSYSYQNPVTLEGFSLIQKPSCFFFCDINKATVIQNYNDTLEFSYYFFFTTQFDKSASGSISCQLWKIDPKTKILSKINTMQSPSGNYIMLNNLNVLQMLSKSINLHQPDLYVNSVANYTKILEKSKISFDFPFQTFYFAGYSPYPQNLLLIYYDKMILFYDNTYKSLRYTYQADQSLTLNSNFFFSEDIVVIYTGTQIKLIKLFPTYLQIKFFVKYSKLVLPTLQLNPDYVVYYIDSKLLFFSRSNLSIVKTLDSSSDLSKFIVSKETIVCVFTQQFAATSKFQVFDINMNLISLQPIILDTYAFLSTNSLKTHIMINTFINPISIYSFKLELIYFNNTSSLNKFGILHNSDYIDDLKLFVAIGSLKIYFINVVTNQIVSDYDQIFTISSPKYYYFPNSQRSILHTYTESGLQTLLSIDMISGQVFANIQFQSSICEQNYMDTLNENLICSVVGQRKLNYYRISLKNAVQLVPEDPISTNTLTSNYCSYAINLKLRFITTWCAISANFRLIKYNIDSLKKIYIKEFNRIGTALTQYPVAYNQEIDELYTQGMKNEIIKLNIVTNEMFNFISDVYINQMFSISNIYITRSNYDKVSIYDIKKNQLQCTVPTTQPYLYHEYFDLFIFYKYDNTDGPFMHFDPRTCSFVKFVNSNVKFMTGVNFLAKQPKSNEKIYLYVIISTFANVKVQKRFIILNVANGSILYRNDYMIKVLIESGFLFLIDANQSVLVFDFEQTQYLTTFQMKETTQSCYYHSIQKKFFFQTSRFIKIVAFNEQTKQGVEINTINQSKDIIYAKLIMERNIFIIALSNYSIIIYNTENFTVADTFFLVSKYGPITSVTDISLVSKNSLLIINTSSNIYFYDLSNSLKQRSLQSAPWSISQIAVNLNQNKDSLADTQQFRSYFIAGVDTQLWFASEQFRITRVEITPNYSISAERYKDQYVLVSFGKSDKNENPSLKCFNVLGQNKNQYQKFGVDTYFMKERNSNRFYVINTASNLFQVAECNTSEIILKDIQLPQQISSVNLQYVYLINKSFIGFFLYSNGDLYFNNQILAPLADKTILFKNFMDIKEFGTNTYFILTTKNTIIYQIINDAPILMSFSDANSGNFSCIDIDVKFDLIVCTQQDINSYKVYQATPQNNVYQLISMDGMPCKTGNKIFILSKNIIFIYCGLQINVYTMRTGDSEFLYYDTLIITNTEQIISRQDSLFISNKDIIKIYYVQIDSLQSGLLTFLQDVVIRHDYIFSINTSNENNLKLITIQLMIDDILTLIYVPRVQIGFKSQFSFNCFINVKQSSGFQIFKNQLQKIEDNNIVSGFYLNIIKVNMIDINLLDYGQFIGRLTDSNKYQIQVYSQKENKKNSIVINDLFENSPILKIIVQNTFIKFTDNESFTHSQLTKQIILEDVDVSEDINNSQINIQNQDNVIISSFKISGISIKADTLFNIQNVEELKIEELVISNLKKDSHLKYLFQIKNIKKLTIKSIVIEDCEDVMINTLFFIYKADYVNIQQFTLKNVKNSQQGIVFEMKGNILVYLFSIQIENVDNLQFHSSKNSYTVDNQQIFLGNDQIIYQKISAFNCNLQDSLIYIYSNDFQIQDSNFIQIFNQNSGSSIQSVKSHLLIQRCLFQQSHAKNGGTLQIIDSKNVTILNSKFLNNTAVVFGGAIVSSNSQLYLQDNIIKYNQAIVGGGIYYEELKPILFNSNKKNRVTQQTENQQAFDNQAIIFGQNIGSKINKIQISQIINEEIINMKTSSQENNITDFKSGQKIIIEFDLYDEENNKVTVNQSLRKISQEQIQSILGDVQIKIQPIDSEQKVSLSNSIICSFLNFNQQTFKWQSTELKIIGVPTENAQLEIFSDQIGENQEVIVGTDYTPTTLWQLSKTKLSILFRKCRRGEIIGIRDELIECISCQKGFYSLQIPENDSQIECHPCPESAYSCEQDKIFLKEGYWRKSENTDHIIYCSNSPQNCIGSTEGNINNCQEGYIGALCESCDSLGNIWGQRFMRRKNHKCLSCNEVSQYIFLLPLILILLLIISYIIFSISIAIKMSRGYCYSYYFRRAGIISLGTSAFKDKTPFYIKQLMHYLQVASLINNYDFKFPDIIKFIPETISIPIENLEYTLDCTLNQISSHIDLPVIFLRQLWSIIIPLIYTFAIGIIYFILIAMKRTEYSHYYAYHGLFFMLIFIQPNMISRLVSAISCRSVDGVYYTHTDSSYLCGTHEHIKYSLIIILPSLLLWIFVIPLIILYSLYKHRDNLESVQVRFKFGFLYQEFQNKFFYWEFIKSYKKILIVLIYNYSFDHTYILSFSIGMILICYNYFTSVKQPYLQKKFNKIDKYLTIILLCLLLYNVALYDTDLEWFEVLGSNLVATVHNVVVFGFFLVILYVKINVHFTKQLIYVLKTLKGKLYFLFFWIQIQKPINALRAHKNWKKLNKIVNIFIFQNKKILTQSICGVLPTQAQIITTDFQGDDVRKTIQASAQQIAKLDKNIMNVSLISLQQRILRSSPQQNLIGKSTNTNLGLNKIIDSKNQDFTQKLMSQYAIQYSNKSNKDSSPNSNSLQKTSLQDKLQNQNNMRRNTNNMYSFSKNQINPQGQILQRISSNSSMSESSQTHQSSQKIDFDNYKEDKALSSISLSYKTIKKLKKVRDKSKSCFHINEEKTVNWLQNSNLNGVDISNDQEKPQQYQTNYFYKNNPRGQSLNDLNIDLKLQRLFDDTNQNKFLYLNKNLMNQYNQQYLQNSGYSPSNLNYQIPQINHEDVYIPKNDPFFNQHIQYSIQSSQNKRISQASGGVSTHDMYIENTQQQMNEFIDPPLQSFSNKNELINFEFDSQIVNNGLDGSFMEVQNNNKAMKSNNSLNSPLRFKNQVNTNIDYGGSGQLMSNMSLSQSISGSKFNDEIKNNLSPLRGFENQKYFGISQLNLKELDEDYSTAQQNYNDESMNYLQQNKQEKGVQQNVIQNLEKYKKKPRTIQTLNNKQQSANNNYHHKKY